MDKEKPISSNDRMGAAWQRLVDLLHDNRLTLKEVLKKTNAYAGFYAGETISGSEMLLYSTAKSFERKLTNLESTIMECYPNFFGESDGNDDISARAKRNNDEFSDILKEMRQAHHDQNKLNIDCRNR